ncbi:hypothetical protein RCL1_004241 [Eukaryota sp. TZLM3-RCL]
MTKHIPHLQPNLDAVANSTFFILQHLGPLAFVVSDTSAIKFRVILGDLNSCSCNHPFPCVHFLFLLQRYFKVPSSSHLLCKSSFTSLEIDHLCYSKFNSSTKLQERPTNSPSSSLVQTRDITNDDDCSICMCPLLSTEPVISLVYCSSSCGNSFHPECISQYVAHSLSTLNTSPKCPLCRGMFEAKDYQISGVTLKPVSSYVQQGVTCSKCRFSCKGPVYKCTTCKSLSLCLSCMSTGFHSHHSFVCKANSDSIWTEVLDSRKVSDLLPKLTPSQAGLVSDVSTCCSKIIVDSVYTVLPCNHVLCKDCSVEGDQNSCKICQLSFIPEKIKTRKVQKDKIKTIVKETVPETGPLEISSSLSLSLNIPTSSQTKNRSVVTRKLKPMSSRAKSLPLTNNVALSISGLSLDIEGRN